MESSEEVANEMKFVSQVCINKVLSAEFDLINSNRLWQKKNCQITQTLKFFHFFLQFVM